MELAESAYLYALAQIGIVFAGFTALFMMLRQTLGGEASAMDFFVTRNLLMLSFLVVSGAMLPSLLAAFSLQHDLIWRAASATVAVPLLAFVVSLPWRRRTVISGRTPGFIWLRELIHAAAVAILALNVVGLLGGPTGGPFELGLSLILFAQSFSFVMTMGQLLALHHRSK
jgi:hypothetical protein